VADAMGRVIRSLGGQIEVGINVDSIHESSIEVRIGAGERYWTAKRLVACAGLQSDRLARIAGCKIAHQIVPFVVSIIGCHPTKVTLSNISSIPSPIPTCPFWAFT
jgi:L-2-hydroxyglutarate oxidase